MATLMPSTRVSLVGKVKKCPKCRFLRMPDQNFCPICGSELVLAKIIKCKCGEELLAEDGGDFCDKCGRNKVKPTKET